LTGRQLITDNGILRARYDQLAAGDLVLSRVRIKPGEEPLLLDLVERGVLLFPSALSQLASRSKTLQARLFAARMLPGTRVICDLHDLLESINVYNREQITRVVTKHDRRNAGMGIHLWPSIEEVYTQASFNTLPFPFVLQPFRAASRDLRVVIIGDYVEAYERYNPHNFRHNLHCGGQSTACEPSASQLAICREVMARGRYPYAHLDLMVMAGGESYLAEINLRGGIRGARITPKEYQERVTAIHRQQLAAWGDCKQTPELQNSGAADLIA
jgi:glutathione synthase/RimK-type ligase-like ATP-grasp enzyme